MKKFSVLSVLVLLSGFLFSQEGGEADDGYNKFSIKEKKSLGDAEAITSIRKRFGSGSMSHGDLSKEAHETL